MAIKKRHHYIPLFYLKRFSVNEEGKFIGLYNHQNKIFIQKAPLKHQACKNFLYGDSDEIENALADMESKIAKLFFYWTEERLLYPPPIESNGFKLLRQFILYQAFRIPKSGNELRQSFNEGLETIKNEFRWDLSAKLTWEELIDENPVLVSLINSVRHEHLLEYLDCKFIVNLSELPLITSDAPVIFYNQLMEAAGNYIGATALAAKGLQIFYPIHPRLMICLYDSNVYDLCRESDNCCATESIEEVHQLNALQLINSDAQLFFDEIISERYIRTLCEQYFAYKRKYRSFNTFIKQGSRKFFFTGAQDPCIKLNLKFFKLLENPKNYKNDIRPLRHSFFDKKNKW